MSFGAGLICPYYAITGVRILGAKFVHSKMEIHSVPEKLSVLSRCLLFRGVHKAGFHCRFTDWMKAMQDFVFV